MECFIGSRLDSDIYRYPVFTTDKYITQKSTQSYEIILKSISFFETYLAARSRSIRFSGFSSIGSPCNTRSASFRARVNTCPSLPKSAIFRSKAKPLCRVPERSPDRATGGPSRPVQSHRWSKPSPQAVYAIRTKACRHSSGCNRIGPHRARPAPRNWCSCERPKRSALSITMTEAFGTSTPTSITEVATMICATPCLKRFMPYSLSAVSSDRAPQP